METTAKYRLMGAFTLATVIGLFGFVYWLNNVAGLTERRIYQIRFQSAVPGLRPGAIVQFNGIRVGEVTDLRLDAQMPQRVTATIAIDAATPVRADTQVGLDFQGLMGVTSVALKGGASEASRLVAAEGALPLLIADASAGADLSTTAREALRRLDGMLADNADALRGTMSNFNTFTGALARNSDRIDGIVAGLERMTGGADSKGPAQSFDLTAPRVAAHVDRSRPGPMAVGDPTALIMYDSQKLVIRNASGTRATMAGPVQWADTLPKLVQARIVQTLESAMSPAAVVRGIDNLASERQLLLDIRAFEVVDSETPTATVELAAKIAANGNQVFDARVFTATAPASSTGASDAAAALDRAFGKVAAEIAAWVQNIP
jgi:phospholipid/cholesterol/gamma-HCH transport system substrate-binding protein